MEYEARLNVRKEIPSPIVSFFPSLDALERAVWFGDTKNFSPKLVKAFEGAGLLPVLALSGQHVGILVSLLSFFLLPLRPLLGSAAFTFFLPLLSTILLWVTSKSAPSMTRTLVMMGILLIVKARGLIISPFEVLCFCIGLVLLSDPSTALRPGFVLSVAGIFSLMTAGHFASFFLPILIAPWISYLFGTFSPHSLWASPLLCWIWELFLIPLGFLLPLLRYLPSGSLQFLEICVDTVLQSQLVILEWVGLQKWPVMSLGLGELLLILPAVFCFARSLVERGRFFRVK
jgi:predicted membrane metal-binding protein